MKDFIKVSIVFSLKKLIGDTIYTLKYKLNALSLNNEVFLIFNASSTNFHSVQSSHNL